MQVDDTGGGQLPVEAEGAVGAYPWVGVSLMPHTEYRRAIQPLLDHNLIDAIEWRFYYYYYYYYFVCIFPF